MIVKLLHPPSRNSQGQETLLPPSIDMQTYNYDNDCSNHQKLGAIFASTYTRMGFYKIKIYTLIRNKFTLPVCNYFKKNWKRFLDDFFIFLILSLIKPNELLDVLHNISRAIQFTMEISDTQLPFLDIMINKEGKRFSWIFI